MGRSELPPRLPHILLLQGMSPVPGLCGAQCQNVLRLAASSVWVSTGQPDHPTLITGGRQ